MGAFSTDVSEQATDFAASPAVQSGVDSEPPRRPLRRRGLFGGLGILVAIAVALAFAGSSAATATCTIYWTGATSSAWATASNWSLTDGGGSAGRIPAATDFVCMSTSPTTASVTTATNISVTGINFPQSGSIQPSLTVSSGTLTLGTTTTQNASAINKLTISGTLVVVNGETVTTSNLTMNGGVLEGPGSLTDTGPATLISDPALGASGAGSKSADLILQGSTSVNDDVQFWSGSVLENAGTLTLADSAELFAQDSTACALRNDSGATVSFTGSTAAQTATIALTASNAGTVSVGKGTLTFGQGANGTPSDTGQFTASSGATLDVAGTRTEQSGATITGAGTVDVVGGATVTLASGSAVTNSGTFQVDGTLGVASGASVSAANLTLNGVLLGPGVLTVTGPASLNNGQLGQSSKPATKVHLILQGATTANGAELWSGSEVENQGTLTLPDSGFLVDEDSAGNTFVNDAGATVSFSGSTAAQTAQVAVTASNAGTVSVGKGTLTFGNDSIGTASDSGQFTASSGATLDVAGTRTEQSGATIPGRGRWMWLAVRR